MWEIKRFDGQWEHTLSATVERLATTKEKKAWGRPPVSMSFQVHPSKIVAGCRRWCQGRGCASCWPGVQVPMFSSSGLRVQYLKVWEKSSYKVDKWVRKVCKSGDYQIRTQ